MMDRLISSGRYVFGIAIASFGLQHYIFVSSHPALAPGPPWILGSAFAASGMGAFLLVLGIGIVAGKDTVLWASALGVLQFTYVVVLYAPRLATNLTDPRPWTSSTELLAMSGAALALAGTRGEQPVPRPWTRMSDRIAATGRLIFAVPLAVFGVQHFMYAQFTATLVPAWIPWRLFWACFVGAAFIAASIGIAVKVQARLAATLLGVMFFLIVVLLHVPRLFTHAQSGNEWTSALVALTMFGASFVVARSCRAPITVALVSSTVSQAWGGSVGNPPQLDPSSHSVK
ncbi:MAG TPA: hypothetical protein VIX19_11120 [Terriglobales bacterium]